jgi:hypothetical protein
MASADFEEGEINIDDNEYTTVGEAPTVVGPIPPTSETMPAGTLPIVEEEVEEPLDYGGQGHSPSEIIFTAHFYPFLLCLFILHTSFQVLRCYHIIERRSRTLNT